MIRQLNSIIFRFIFSLSFTSHPSKSLILRHDREIDRPSFASLLAIMHPFLAILLGINPDFVRASGPLPCPAPRLSSCMDDGFLIVSSPGAMARREPPHRRPTRLITHRLAPSQPQACPPLPARRTQPVSSCPALDLDSCAGQSLHPVSLMMPDKDTPPRVPKTRNPRPRHDPCLQITAFESIDYQRLVISKDC